MSPKTLEFLDQSLRYSLWAFLIFFLVALVYIAIRVGRQSKLSMLRSAVQAVIASAVIAAVTFVVISFVPLPFLENFATARTLEVVPLRMTSLVQERTHEGFKLEAEVWNQTKEPMEEVKAVIHIYNADRAVLEEVTASVEPRPLPAGTAGVFKVEYAKNSPFLYGYEISFAGPKGEMIPHIKGFDVH